MNYLYEQTGVQTILVRGFSHQGHHPLVFSRVTGSVIQISRWDLSFRVLVQLRRSVESNGHRCFPTRLISVLIRNQQSQLGGVVLSPKQQHRLAADYILQLSEEGLLRRRTLELMDGSASLKEIARQLVAEFPKRFSNSQQALSYAGVISQEFSR